MTDFFFLCFPELNAMNFWNNGNMIKLVIYYIIWILQLHLSMFLGVGKRKRLSDIVKKYINNNHKTVFDENSV